MHDNLGRSIADEQTVSIYAGTFDIFHARKSKSGVYIVLRFCNVQDLAATYASGTIPNLH